MLLGKVYGGKLSRFNERNVVAFKRLDERFGQRGSEMILVYEHASRGSLDHILNDATLTWIQRLKICIDAAKGLSFLHDPNRTHQSYSL
uniref:Protein kinase-like domain, phloem protein 2-like protein n=1 Tax=Tanacetum cinerariifolium TaxID=118510 RepID=A0A6L2LA06_TANCI|nr:protein kinase-like domain, phloem protein 2-like protein [Tanacetum cinerariifolium]